MRCEIMKMICISCPKGCELDVTSEPGGEVIVKGNACPRGESYGKDELVNPTRVVTGLVRVAWTRRPLPVKTNSPIPKSKIEEVLSVLHRTTVQLPVKIGDVLISDVAGTGVDIVSTVNM
jgi:CxxC motif-containing protein